jgi:hypothetical protein
LHTTETPVAFSQARVKLNHQTGRIECQNYLYTGVYLSVRCHAVFRHYLSHAKYHRDFPFGEEETLINQIYPNTYTRITDDKHGLTLIHNGIQRAENIPALPSQKVVQCSFIHIAQD